MLSRFHRFVKNGIIVTSLGAIFSNTTGIADIIDHKEFAQEFLESTGKHIAIGEEFVLPLEVVEIKSDPSVKSQVEVRNEDSSHDDFSRNNELFSNNYFPKPDTGRIDTFSTYFDSWNLPLLLNGSKLMIPSNGFFNFIYDPDGDISVNSVGSIANLVPRYPGDRPEQFVKRGSVYFGTIDSGINLELLSGNWFVRGSFRRDNSDIYAKISEDVGDFIPKEIDFIGDFGWRDGNWIGEGGLVLTRGSLSLDESVRGVGFLEQESSANLVYGKFGTHDLAKLFRWSYSDVNFDISSGNLNNVGNRDENVFVRLNQHRFGLESIFRDKYFEVGLGNLVDLSRQRTLIKDLGGIRFTNGDRVINPELEDYDEKIREIRPYVFLKIPFEMIDNDVNMGLRVDGNFQLENPTDFYYFSGNSYAFGFSFELSRQINDKTSFLASVGRFSSFSLIPDNLSIHRLEAMRTGMNHDSSQKIYAIVRHNPIDFLNFTIDGTLQKYKLYDGDIVEDSRYCGIKLVTELEFDELRIKNTIKIGESTENGFPTESDQRIINIFRGEREITESIKLYSWAKFGSGYHFTPFYDYKIGFDEESPPGYLESIGNTEGRFPGRFRSQNTGSNISYSVGLDYSEGNNEIRLGWIHSNEIISVVDGHFTRELPNIFEISLKRKF